MIMLSNNQIQLEQEILGSMLKESSLAINAIEKIKPEMFLYSKHMRIYLGILEMIEEKLKTELKLDTFVKVDGDQIRVVVGSKEHSASLANEVMRLIQELFDSKMYISVQFQN